MNSEKNLSLWQLTNEHQKLMSQLYNFETGEIDEIVQAKINSLYKTEEEKCIAVTQWVKKLESEERQLQFMLEELQERIGAYQARIDRHKRDLQINMESRGITNISCPLFTIKLKKNPYSTDILDEKQIPQQFIKVKEVVKVNVSVDKNLIKEEVLRTGHQVPGAYVSQKNKLEILIGKI